MSTEVVKNNVRWIDVNGNPVHVSSGITANGFSENVIRKIECGEALGDVENLIFRDPNEFCAGELHNNVSYWEIIAERNPSTSHDDVLRWIRGKVSIFSLFSVFQRFL